MVRRSLSACGLVFSLALIPTGAVQAADPAPAHGAGALDRLRLDEIGGDDVSVVVTEHPSWASIDIASNGDIYAAVALGPPTSLASRIEVYRSQDGGDTWREWGRWEDPGLGQYLQPSLVVAEGVVDRCFVAFGYADLGYQGSIIVAWSPLSSINGDWTEGVVMPAGDNTFWQASLATDAESFSSYYLYLVAAADDGNGDDIWFTRSTTQGNSFETPYKIAQINSTLHRYLLPSVSYGLGGYVHVAWEYDHEENLFDSAIRYRRASSYATGGISAWDPPQLLTTTSDGYWDHWPKVTASLHSDDVVLAHERGVREGYYWYWRDPAVYHSVDQGVSFPVQTPVPGGLQELTSIVQVPTTGQWLFAGATGHNAALQRANAGDPTQWTAIEYFVDEDYDIQQFAPRPIALDPTHDYRAASLWSVHRGVVDDQTMFDAEWRNDPGYPNYADGFPMDLDHTPHSPPALADLDRDGDLEILYTDEGGVIRAYHHDGLIVTGWPVATGHPACDGPLAVGALDWSGEMRVVVGTADGWVLAYNAQGNLLPGWPYDSGSGTDAYVSIGALGDSYPRTVVVASGSMVRLLNIEGQYPPGNENWSTVGRRFHSPCAIGDINGDGEPEVVGAADNRILAVRPFESYPVIERPMPSVISDAITLGDLDLDGDVEIIVPTEDGTLYALEGNGDYVAGDWPFVSSTASALTSGAIAQVYSTFEPEVAVAANDWTVHLLLPSGTQAAGYPVETSGHWYILGAPVIGLVTGAPDIIVGARDDRVWSWGNLGEPNPGWPKDLGEKVNLSPAYGDLDGDGLSELVVLTLDRMAVLELNQVLPTANRTWAMYGHDAQRTGCADCPEYFDPSAVPASSQPVTALSFAAPSPKTRQSPGTFRYALPHYAAVALELFDVQGRCVRTVLKAEQAAGEYEVGWDGCDRANRPLPAGHYLARLRVRGEGRERSVLRKVVVVP